MATNWYFRDKDAIAGPLPASSLVLFARQGRVLPETLVRKGDAGKWVRAERISGLFSTECPDPKQTATERTANGNVSRAEPDAPPPIRTSPEKEGARTERNKWDRVQAILFHKLGPPGFMVEVSRRLRHKLLDAAATIHQQIDNGSLPLDSLVNCPCCRRRVSQTADSCPKCGNNFTVAVMETMKRAAYQQKVIGNYFALGFGGFFLLLFVSCIAIVSTSPGPSRSHMTGREYHEANEFLNHLNSQGVSDTEIKRAVDSELRRRGEY